MCEQKLIKYFYNLLFLFAKIRLRYYIKCYAAVVFFFENYFRKRNSWQTHSLICLVHNNNITVLPEHQDCVYWFQLLLYTYIIFSTLRKILPAIFLFKKIVQWIIQKVVTRFVHECHRFVLSVCKKMFCKRFPPWGVCQLTQVFI